MTKGMTDPKRNEPGLVLTPEQARSRRARNIGIGLAIAAIMLIFYVITLVKLDPSSAIPSRLR